MLVVAPRWRLKVADPLRGVFRKPFAQQVAAFRLRLGNLVPTSRWDDITHQQHDRAFMVAGAMKADLLADLGAAVDKAISEGTGLEEFRRDFRAIVERRGWHGWTGEGTAKGEAWRTRVIYKTNMLTSMAGGRHAQLVDGNFKYWVYAHSGAEHPRLDHLSWNGLILPSGHPFWKTHYPPNGWGCGCKVRGANTLAGAIRIGGDPIKTLPDDWADIDPNTGTYSGIGQGWDYAPGASQSAIINALTQKVIKWPYVLGKEFMEGLPADTVDAFAESYRAQPSLALSLRRYSERAFGQRNGAPVTNVVVEQYKTLGRLTSRMEADAQKLLGQDLSGYDFSLSADSIRHILSQHGDAATEALRGQRGIVPDDFGQLGNRLNIIQMLRVEDGSLIAEVDLGSERVQLVFRPLRKRRMLNLVTMWVIKKAP